MIDASIRVSLVGVDLLTVEALVVIASLETYVDCAETLGFRQLVAVSCPAEHARGRDAGARALPRHLLQNRLLRFPEMTLAEPSAKGGGEQSCRRPQRLFWFGKNCHTRRDLNCHETRQPEQLLCASKHARRRLRFIWSRLTKWTVINKDAACSSPPMQEV